MPGRRPTHLPLVAAAASALVLGLLGAATAVSAAPAGPAPAPVTEPRPAPPAPAGSEVRIRLNASFMADLARSGAVIVGTGRTEVRGDRTLRIPIDSVSSEGYALGGGFALEVDGERTYRCPDIAVWRQGNIVFCGQDGRARPLLALGDPRDEAREGGWVTRSDIPLRIATVRGATRLNEDREGAELEVGDVIGQMDLRFKRLLRSDDYESDDRTGCDMGGVAGDNSIWRGWAIQAMVNRLPAKVGLSTFVDGKIVDPAVPGVAVGQRTPYREAVNTLDAKRIVRGSSYDSDNFYEGPSYGCNSNAPFVVGQGELGASSVRAWTYDGTLRTQAAGTLGGPARPQWWGHARQTNYNGPTGNYSWTCRGVPTGQADTYWARVSAGSGFFGDGSRDRVNPDAGRVPLCPDLNLEGAKITTRYSISKRGATYGPTDNDYPRGCTVEGNPLIGCWQELYPLWDRAWAFQNHVYASVMRANIKSNATIKIPAAWSPTGVEMTKPISWRISDGDITGAWPKYRDAQGNVVDTREAITARDADQDYSKVSPLTVPGTNAPFTVAGYGTPMGRQEMSFLLTADTDGTWTWPVNAKTQKELPRMQVKVTFRYVISNYNNGSTCKDGYWFDDAWFGSGRNNDTAGRHCLQGSVPTIWPLPANKDDYAERMPDAKVVDKDGKSTDNFPTSTFESVTLQSCLLDREIRVQEVPKKTAPNVGADFTWDINVSGQLTSFSSC